MVLTTNNSSNNNHQHHHSQSQSSPPPLQNDNNNNNRLVSCGRSLVDATALQKQLDTIFAQRQSKTTTQSILHDMNQQRIEHPQCPGVVDYTNPTSWRRPNGSIIRNKENATARLSGRQEAPRARRCSGVPTPTEHEHNAHKNNNRKVLPPD